MNVFVTTETVMWTGSDSLGWAGVHNGPLVIHTAPGDHLSVLSERFAAEFTALLSACLSGTSAGFHIPADAAALTGRRGARRPAIWWTQRTRLTVEIGR